MYLKQKLISFMLAIACILTVSVPAVVETSEPAVGVVASVIGGAIVVVIASALMPIVLNQTADTVASAQSHGDDATANLADLWPFGLALAVFVAIFAFAM